LRSPSPSDAAPKSGAFSPYRIHHAVPGCTQTVHQDLASIRAGHRVHRVELDPESAAQQGADRGEVEQRFHQPGIIRNRIDHRHGHIAGLVIARPVEGDIGRIGNAVLRDLFACREDRFGDLLRRGAAVGGVVLDAEIAVRSAGIVTGRQDDTAKCAIFADHAGGRGCRKYAALADQHAPVSVGCRHLQNDLDRFAVVKAAVASQHQRSTRRCSDGIKDALHEVFQIVRLPECRNTLAQSGSARFLIGKGSCLDSMDFHRCHEFFIVVRSVFYHR
jgi:hypothetical protein